MDRNAFIKLGGEIAGIAPSQEFPGRIETLMPLRFLNYLFATKKEENKQKSTNNEDGEYGKFDYGTLGIKKSGSFIGYVRLDFLEAVGFVKYKVPGDIEKFLFINPFNIGEISARFIASILLTSISFHNSDVCDGKVIELRLDFLELDTLEKQKKFMKEMESQLIKKVS